MEIFKQVIEIFLIPIRLLMELAKGLLAGIIENPWIILIILGIAILSFLNAKAK